MSVIHFNRSDCFNEKNRILKQFVCVIVLAHFCLLHMSEMYMFKCACVCVCGKNSGVL